MHKFYLRVLFCAWCGCLMGRGGRWAAAGRGLWIVASNNFYLNIAMEYLCLMNIFDTFLTTRACRTCTLLVFKKQMNQNIYIVFPALSFT
jgi:hypothetical protein